LNALLLHIKLCESGAESRAQLDSPASIAREKSLSGNRITASITSPALDSLKAMRA
jgi:hypothetical protein